MKKKSRKNTLHDIPGVPQRKISETILDFAMPLIDLFERKATAEEMNSVITLAIAVWNSVVLKDWDGNDRYLAMANDCFCQAGLNEPKVMFQVLVERKQRFFADDLRAVGNFDITTDPSGQYRLHAEARLPESMLKTQ